MLVDIKINYQKIQDRIGAARSLQDAGQDQESKTIALSIARDILKELGKQKDDQ